jgi:transposase InsO family protein
MTASMTKEQVYQAAGITRQGYFRAKGRQGCKQELEDIALQKVVSFKAKQPKIGARVMYHMLKIDTMGINRFERLVSDNHLGVRTKRKHIKTTNGVYEQADKNYIHGYNLRDINQVIVGDITYFRSRKGELFYIFSLKDAYSKRIVGIDAYHNMYAEHALEVLEQVITIRGKDSLCNTIHHTDAGGQYKSNIYKARLKDCQMIQSISDNCLENGMAEQLNYIIKDQQLALYNVQSLSQLKRIIKQVQHFLNCVRPIHKLQYRTPDEFEQWIATLETNERPVQILHDFKTAKE